MRKYIFLILLIFPTILQAQSWMMSCTASGTGNFNTIDIHLDQENNKYVVGIFNESLQIKDQVFNSRGLYDILLVKLDESGDFIWAEQIRSDQTVLCAGISIDESSIYISGSFKDSCFFTGDTLTNTDNFDFFLAKYDLDKNLIWAKSAGYGLKQQKSLTITTDRNGDVLVSGYFQDSIKFDVDTLTAPVGGSGGFYSKFDSEGELLWSKAIIAPAGSLVYFTGATSFSDINYFTGYWKGTVDFQGTPYTSDGSLQDIFIFKTDGNGDLLWSRTLTGAGSDIGYSLASDQNGNVLLGGITYSNIVVDSTSSEVSKIYYGRIGGADLLLAKYRLDGTLDWAKVLGSISDDKVNFLFAQSDLIHFTGSFTYQFAFGDQTVESNGTLDKAAFLAGIDTDGNPQYIRSINGTDSNDDQGISLNQDDQGNICLVGTSKSVTLSIGDSTYTNIAPGTNMGFITQYGCLPINIISETPMDISCNSHADGSLTVDADGGFSTNLLYSIDGGATYAQNGGTFTDLVPGDYNIMVKDSLGCEVTGGSHTISEPDALAFTYNLYDVVCNGEANGSIAISPSGGTPDYMFASDGGTEYGTEDSITGLAAGNYTLVVKDANDCVTTGEAVDIIEPDELTISLVSQADITDNADGEIVVEGAGGTAPYTFTITPSAGTQDPDGTFTLEPGDEGEYTIEVDDANNCGPVSTEAITITYTNIESGSIVDGKIFPNPSSGIITVEFATDKAEMAMEVYSMSGQRVMNRQVFSIGGEVSESFDLSSLAKGTYLIRVDGETLSSGVILK